MTSIFVSMFFFMGISLIAAVLVADNRDRAFLFNTVLAAWLMLATLTALINGWLPFSGEGDDSGYYDLVSSSGASFDRLLDFGRFAGEMEQPGFPMLLSLIGIFVTPDLLSYKMLNLCVLILTALTWYRIASLLESSKFGRVVFVIILLLTPLWYYVFFLLKDLTIALLQSVFLLALVRNWQRNTPGSWLLMGVATFGLLPFRTFLVLQNGFVLAAALALKSFGRKSGSHISIVLGATFVAGLLAIASNQAFMNELGVFSEHRIIGSQEMRESVGAIQESSEMNRALFPLLYLFSETAGLNPRTWEVHDFALLRGVLAVPWIFLVVPFFLVGLHWLFRSQPDALPGVGMVARLHRTRFVATPWGVLALFVLSMMAISWIVGDTTRWRISDMPVIATIASAGWTFAAHRIRQQILTLWVVGGASLFLLFYSLRDI